ncbi:CDP-diacylglycerol---serine O-phosphatidyltransferase [Desulfonatronum thiosulfatophilum]|uniref:CDP-diacylglycerol--serine O-phosphatidyltransferase n=1 Tax=Desulfonatronum thiosulfatophilum TaxID=617002 RepID=A0A1G6ABV6_9BACT|nr:CDP-diacylglycerol--serine O-phosphatidyltransferase [Desulfonatronum thiosulfatophilum]SDB05553.1 CDP-diacylglycerol---serine O-phosphatidyltransferase [Desulfonatronum thiosulfatophilum]
MNRQNQPICKGVYLLPNLFTTASLFSGFLGIVWAIEGLFVHCALAILVSCVLDGLDGMVARLTRSTSEFGVQLDSLADLVAFGVTPAIMVYMWQLQNYGRLGLVASFLLVACGALRLARFNVQSGKVSQKYFIGLPIPAAACVLATLVLFSTVSPGFLEDRFGVLTLTLVYVLSFLMVSRVRYLSLKEFEGMRTHPFRTTVVAMLMLVVIASEPKVIGFMFFLTYLISGLVLSFLILPFRKLRLLRESPNELP